MRWQEQAACAVEDNSLFFPKAGGTHKARAICARCPVQGECLEYALTNHIAWGVWGGADTAERRAIARGEQPKVYRGPGRLPDKVTECLWGDNARCGTRWGYEKGCRSELCLAAERQLSTERRRRKKEQAHAQEHEHRSNVDSERVS